MRRAGIALSTLLFAAVALARPAAAAEFKVVATIKPLHALVAQVMAGAGTPDLLVKGSASPHTYALKPSDARALNQADLFFRMSEIVEPFTTKVVKSLPRRVEVVTLQEAPGLTLLARRLGATFEPHAHGHRHDHGHPPKADAADGHVWLDPHNAKAMVAQIAAALSSRDQANAALYAANAEAAKARLDVLAAELEAALAPLAGKPYIVFHDAFQYFERRFNLNVVGSISISPDIPPSARRLSQLRQKIASLGAMCVFAEPQFSTRLVDTLIEGTAARTGTLDPEGGRLEPGPDLYATLMRNLAADLRSCLLNRSVGG
jgi:zinc transport system substrate-binding protein